MNKRTLIFLLDKNLHKIANRLSSVHLQSNANILPEFRHILNHSMTTVLKSYCSYHLKHNWAAVYTKLRRRNKYPHVTIDSGLESEVSETFHVEFGVFALWN